MTSQLSTKFRNQVTWNGYPADVMKSGLQKYIRRGMIEKALYCAGELDLFKEEPEKGEGIRTNFLHRLMVIFMEDVENLSMLQNIDQKMKEIFLEREKGAERSKEKEERLLSEVVIQLGASTKARVCSHIRAVFNLKYKPIRESYPSMMPIWSQIEKNEQERTDEPFEYHCKMFTKYLKEKNILAVYYGFQIGLSEEKLKTKIFGRSQPVFYLFQEMTKESVPYIETFISWYKGHIGALAEGFMCWLVPLLHHMGVVSQGTLPVVGGYSMNWDKNRAGEKIEVDDFVLDKHTAKGRGKGLVEFALRGSLVENQADFVNPLWKQFYEDGKRFEEGVPILTESSVSLAPTVAPAVVVVPKKRGPKVAKPVANPEEKVDDLPQKESDAYTFVVRTQLTTMGTKMDVYFAKDPSGKLVVVKGPYSTRKEIDILVSNTEWKKKYNLLYNRFEVTQLMPDRWPEGVPLGARNKIDRNRPAFFLVFDSYIAENQLRITQRKSTLWPLTDVVDWEKIPFHFDYKARQLTKQEMIDYVHALLFRYVLGISDYADRNFVMKDGRVISIDEDVENHEINLYKVLQKNKAEFVYQWLKEHYEELDVAQWQPKIPSQQGRINEIQKKESCLRLFKSPDDAGTVAQEVEAPIIEVPVTKVETLPVVQSEPKPEVAQKDKIKPEITISKMNDSFVLIDNIYRSRMTLLDILEARGYDVDIYRKFSPAEATAAAAASSLAALNFTASKKGDATKKCDVRYANVTRPKLETFFDDIADADSENVEVVVMIDTHVINTHHLCALKQYMKLKEEPNQTGEKVRRKLRVSFFCIDMLVVNPLKHVLVPKHEIVPEKDHKELMASMYITAKSKFPEIKFHLDPIARCIGAIPGDIIKITRPSASSGQSIMYRVCAP